MFRDPGPSMNLGVTEDNESVSLQIGDIWMKRLVPGVAVKFRLRYGIDVRRGKDARSVGTRYVFIDPNFLKPALTQLMEEYIGSPRGPYYDLIDQVRRSITAQSWDKMVIEWEAPQSTDEQHWRDWLIITIPLHP